MMFSYRDASLLVLWFSLYWFWIFYVPGTHLSSCCLDSVTYILVTFSCTFTLANKFFLYSVWMFDRLLNILVISLYYEPLWSRSEISDVSDHHTWYESSNSWAVWQAYVGILFVRASRGSKNRPSGFRFNEFFLIQGINTAWEKIRGLIWVQKSWRWEQSR